MLRTKTFFFLLLLCLCHHSIRASEQQFPDIDAAIKSRREAIESQDEYSKINTRIASIDKNSRHLLKTAHDYVALLAFNNSSYTPGQWRDLNDQFLRNNLRDFFEKKPSLKEMIALSHMGRDVDIQTEIKENGLGLVHNAADYLALITTDVDTMRHLIKPEEESSKIKKFINFISSSLKTFKATRPSLDDVVSLKNYIAATGYYQKETKRFATLLNEIDETFFDCLTTAKDYPILLMAGDREWRYDYHRRYKSAEEFLTQHVDDFLAKNPTLEEIQSLEFAFEQVNSAVFIKLRTYELKFVNSPDDYLKLVGVGTKNMHASHKQEVINIIRTSLKLFKGTNPTIDHVMKLHTHVIRCNADEEEEMVATLLKLKEEFIKDFKGTDLLRLLDYGAAGPSETYKRQLLEFKKMYADLPLL